VESDNKIYAKDDEEMKPEEAPVNPVHTPIQAV
jgi:hypothetical protein